MTTRTLYPTRKEIPVALRCARSGCRRRAIVEPGVTPQVCLPHAKKRRTNKYGSKRSTSPLLGRSFHSQAERARGEELSLLERSGAIRGLRFQVQFPLVVNGITICRYVGDFCYTDKDGRDVVEDMKGFETDIYRMKKKLMRACLGIDIFESHPKRAKV